MARTRNDVAPGDERTGHPALGRPRRPGTDDAILRATIDLIAEGGVGAATIAAVSVRTGVARASIYLRWPNRDALVAAAIRKAIGRQPFELSGDLAVDFRRGAEQARAILSEPMFRTVVPALIAGLLDTREDSITSDALFPNRQRVADEYRALAGPTGYREDVDPFVPIDMLIGGLLNRLLASGRPPDRAIARQAADAVLASVRRAPEDGAAERPVRPKRARTRPSPQR